MNAHNTINRWNHFVEFEFKEALVFSSTRSDRFFASNRLFSFQLFFQSQIDRDWLHAIFDNYKKLEIEKVMNENFLSKSINSDTTREIEILINFVDLDNDESIVFISIHESIIFANSLETRSTISSLRQISSNNSFFTHKRRL